ncbi:MAG: type I restriction-modification system subunit M N-terminal domain-containing protein [Planctomycetota bacterium]
MGAANILRGKTAGQDYKNYILSLMFYKRLGDQWECETDEAISELERQQGRSFSDRERAVFRKRREHRFQDMDSGRLEGHSGGGALGQAAHNPMQRKVPMHGPR